MVRISAETFLSGFCLSTLTLGFLQVLHIHPKHASLIGGSKLSVTVSMHGCLSHSTSCPATAGVGSSLDPEHNKV